MRKNCIIVASRSFSNFKQMSLQFLFLIESIIASSKIIIHYCQGLGSGDIARLKETEVVFVHFERTLRFLTVLRKDSLSYEQPTSFNIVDNLSAIPPS